LARLRADFDLLACKLGLDEFSESGLVSIVELLWIEFAFLGLDDMLGKIEHFALNPYLGDIAESFLRGTHFIIKIQRRRDQAAVISAVQQCAHPPEKHRP